MQPPPGRDSCTARSPRREGSKRRRGRESTACQETRAGSGDAAGELGRASPDVILGVQGAPEGISATAAPRFKFLGRPPPANARPCYTALSSSPPQTPPRGSGSANGMAARSRPISLARGGTQMCEEQAAVGKKTDASTPGTQTDDSTGQHELIKSLSKVLDSEPLDSSSGKGEGLDRGGTGRQLSGGSCWGRFAHLSPHLRNRVGGPGDPGPGRASQLHFPHL